MDDDSDQVRIKYVRVTNGMDQVFTDRHDGVPIRIDSGQTKNIRLDEAEHIFGLDLSSREAICKHLSRRQGWNTPKFLEVDEKGKPLFQRLFDKIKIEPIMYKLVEVEADPSKPIPADPAVDTARTPRKVDVRV